MLLGTSFDFQGLQSINLKNGSTEDLTAFFGTARAALSWKFGHTGRMQWETRFERKSKRSSEAADCNVASHAESLLLPQPLCYGVRVKPYAGADAERRDTSRLRLFEDGYPADRQDNGVILTVSRIT